MGEGAEVAEEEGEGGGQEGARKESQATKEKATKDVHLEEQERSRTMGTSKKTLRKAIFLLVNKYLPSR